ncbi:protein rep, partial [Klebsiella quasipneumoniae]|uniref:protein rep n=1 Tax=Klebsiella quasipneumoniae TaxID=1463165 RepID=UPI003A5BF404
ILSCIFCQLKSDCGVWNGIVGSVMCIRVGRWVVLWRECLGVSYDANVDVRAVKPRKPKDGESLACATAELVRGAVAETLKYSTKPADMVANLKGFPEMPAQTQNPRFLAPAGPLNTGRKLVRKTAPDPWNGNIF